VRRRSPRLLCALTIALAGTPACSRAFGESSTPGHATDPPGGTAVSVAGTTGPTEPGQLAYLVATCPDGSPPAAGGLLADLSTGKPASPSLRLDATRPTGTAWAAVVATGGVAEPGARSRAFALCPPTEIPRIHEVASRLGPRQAGTASLATAPCPPGSTVVGGGGGVDMADGGAAPRFFFLTGSYPSSPAGVPVLAGAAAAWTAVGAIGGMPLAGGRVTAFAVCATGRAPSVVAATIHGPSSPATTVAATATCPPGSVLLGGGANTGLPRATSPPQGLHLRGTYPSHADGRIPSDGELVPSWTAVANAGGLPTLGAVTTAFALCQR